MEAPFDLLCIGTTAGDDYLVTMRLAGDYAHAGQGVVVRQILGTQSAEEVHSQLDSTVHGAGHAMSRTAAAGKSRKR